MKKWCYNSLLQQAIKPRGHTNILSEAFMETSCPGNVYWTFATLNDIFIAYTVPFLWSLITFNEIAALAVYQHSSKKQTQKKHHRASVTLSEPENDAWWDVHTLVNLSKQIEFWVCNPQRLSMIILTVNTPLYLEFQTTANTRGEWRFEMSDRNSWSRWLRVSPYNTSLT